MQVVSRNFRTFKIRLATGGQPAVRSAISGRGYSGGRHRLHLLHKQKRTP
jgi:hypothetical protein